MVNFDLADTTRPTSTERERKLVDVSLYGLL